MKKKLIPFSIAQVEAGAKVVTESGLPVRIVDTNVAGEYPILGLIKKDGAEHPYLWTQNGFSNAGGSYSFDLFIDEEQTERQELTQQENTENKKTSKSIFDTWRSIRFDVFAQAAAGKNIYIYDRRSTLKDDTKLFSLNDIDEIVETLESSAPEVKFKILPDKWYTCIHTIRAESAGRGHEFRTWFEKDRYYLGKYILECDYRMPLEEYQKYFRLWNIQDVPEGTKKSAILASKEYVVLFKGFCGTNIKCHCAYRYVYDQSFSVNTVVQNSSDFHPANGEQECLLFNKMAEEGYRLNPYKEEIEVVYEKREKEKENKKVKRVPFDKKRAKEGAKVVTRNGHPVKIVEYNLKNNTYPILAIINKWGTDIVDKYTWDGKADHLNPNESPSDLLIEEPETRRMTNKELAFWLMGSSPEEHRQYKYLDEMLVHNEFCYCEENEDDPVDDGYVIRSNGGAWKEPLVEI